jgi:Condensation domain
VRTVPDNCPDDKDHAADDLFDHLCPLAPIQEGLLFHSVYSPGSTVYVSQVTCTFEQQLDERAFERAWQTVIDRHSIFRTLFVWENLPEPLQVVLRKSRVRLQKYDWRRLPANTQQQRLKEYLDRDRAGGFDVSKELMRIAIFRLANCRYQFVWTYHHLLMDGWSEFLTFSELSQAYLAYERGDEVRLQSTRPYADYVNWVLGRKLDEAERLWKRTLGGFSVPTALPLDRPSAERPGNEYAARAGRQIEVSEWTTSSLKATAGQAGLTLNTVFMGVWGLILGYYAQRDDVVFGTTVSGRPPSLPAIGTMIGPFINTLPMRVTMTLGTPVRCWLKRLQDRQAELREYEFTPLVEIKKWSDVPPGLPLFESVFTFQNTPFDRRNGVPKVFRVRDVRVSGGWTHYPMTVEVTPGPRATIGVSYDTTRFDGAAVDEILDNFASALDAIARGPEGPLDAVRQHVQERASDRHNSAAIAFERSSVAMLRTTRRNAVPILR